ncbi:MAG: MurR/RpiR family transcriptional regulator [SAR324 cluster bacterium]|nr:MurR/RpiR family transcriptional regulator [SAR324 cluster bacterium]
MDYEHLRNKLVEDYSDLSGRLQQITRYAMTHPNDMALETIAVLAKRTEVPPSSLIRFAKSFGFSGFSEMQKVFQQGLLGRMSEYQKRVQNLNLEISQQEDEIQSNLGYFVQGGIQALQSLRKTVKDEDIEKAASIMIESDVVHIAAQRRSFPIGTYLTYALSHLGVPNILLDSVGGMFPEQGKNIRKGDVLLAISFSPYAHEVLKLAGNVKEQGIPVIVISDSILNPLGLFSDVCMEVEETEIFGFRGVILSALMCLSLSLVVELGSQMEKQKKEVE